MSEEVERETEVCCESKLSSTEVPNFLSFLFYFERATALPVCLAGIKFNMKVTF